MLFCNLLREITKGSGAENITTYEYDASGMRALKKGKYGTVQYVSDNYTVRNKDLVSKHVFAGNSRLVSRVIMNEEKSGKMVATEQGAYYYHSDHLGSSSVVTDKDGRFYEQIEYFPYGETWIHNKAMSEQESTPYKFTSKELDTETGLYYYGARYYDAKLSRWISADPIMGSYLDGKPNGGVYNPINMNLYSYCGNNPVIYNDPDGRFWHIVIGAVVGGALNAFANQGSAEDMGKAFIIGAISGGLAAATMGGSLSWQAAAGLGAFFAMGNTVATELFTDEGEVNPTSVITSGVLGALTGGIGYKIGSVAEEAINLVNPLQTELINGTKAVISALAEETASCFGRIIGIETELHAKPIDDSGKNYAPGVKEKMQKEGRTCPPGYVPMDVYDDKHEQIIDGYWVPAPEPLGIEVEK